VSRFGLVAAFTIRSIYNSDNNAVSIELEISGTLSLPRGHYSTKHCQYCQKHGINHQTLLCNYTNIPSDAEVYDEEHITYASVF